MINMNSILNILYYRISQKNYNSKEKYNIFLIYTTRCVPLSSCMRHSDLWTYKTRNSFQETFESKIFGTNSDNQWDTRTSAFLFCFLFLFCLFQTLYLTLFFSIMVTSSRSWKLTSPMSPSDKYWIPSRAEKNAKKRETYIFEKPSD